MTNIPRVLSIAGTDPSGGAGLQADLKSIQAMGGYGMGVVTVLVAQNTQGVRSIFVPPTEFLAQQLNAVSDDVQIDAVKIGMLHSAPLINAVADWLGQVCPAIVVLDPVMVATSGDRLLDSASENALRSLCSAATLITPNIPELGVLVGQPPAGDWEEACAQAKLLNEATGATVLLKGGHLKEEFARDAIVDSRGVKEFVAKRFATKNTHGTGCSLSSAMATLAASGLDWPSALRRAKIWIEGAINNADALAVGTGSGPIDHFWELRKTSSLEPTWCDIAWSRNQSLRQAADSTEFVSQLRKGELEEETFHWYLAQDALYLRGYADVLLKAAGQAPTDAEREFWIGRAEGARIVETALHRSRIGEWEPKASSITEAYLSHLHSVADQGNYAQTLAAVLPCFWLYADIGERMVEHNHDAHAYRDWLSTYADPDFADRTRQVIELTNVAAKTASDLELALMAQAFGESMLHELRFFEAPTQAAIAGL